MEQLHPNKVRQFFFLAIIILLFWVIWQQMYYMFSSFLGAVALYVLMRRIIFKLIIGKKWKRSVVAVTLMVSSLIVIVLPFAWIIKILINKVEPYFFNPTPIYAMVTRIQTYLESHFHFQFSDTKYLDNLISTITSLAPRLLGSSLIMITNLGIMYFILYFMIVKCNDMELWLRRNLPFKNSNSEKVIVEMRDMVKANAIGIPVLALIQGVVAMIGYFIFGSPEPVLWGIITGICSVVPLIGTMIAWVPLSLYLLATGHQGAGWGLLIWGLAVIGSSDNVFRFVLQKKLANVHPLITVFGVIIGVNLFGFMGLIYGPLLLSMFFLFVKIYVDEFGKDKNGVPQ